MEVWKDIVEYEELYQVSNLGRVRSSRGIRKHFTSNNGYQIVTLYKNNKHKHHYVHRLVLDTFNPTSDKTMQVNHKDFNRINNFLTNLEWVTPKLNIKHSRDYKRYPKSKATLCEEEVSIIKRMLLNNNYSQREIALMFEVDYRVINNIKTNRRWAEVLPV